MTLKKVKILLDEEVLARNSASEISLEKPDPLLIASEYEDETIALICALFAYGNARLIVKFLQSLEFSLLESSDDKIRKSLTSHYYRFQNTEDVAAIFIALKRLRDIDSIENIFYEGYKKEENVLEGLWRFIDTLKSVHPHKSRGYDFLVGSVPKKQSAIDSSLYCEAMRRGSGLSEEISLLLFRVITSSSKRIFTFFRFI